MINLKYILILSLLPLLAGCGDEEVKIDSVPDIDTTEMFTGGQGLIGAVSEKLHPDLDPETIPSVGADYNRGRAEAMGLSKYETSKQSKAKIKAFLKEKGGMFTFDNKGKFGAFIYKAQALNIPGNISDYEIKAVFVRNEDDVSMLYDYGIRWQCKRDDSSAWTTGPCL